MKRGPAFAESVCVASICEETHGASKDGGVDAGPPDPLWGCMDKPRVASTASGPFKVTFHLAGILDPAPIAGVTAFLCKKLDVDCGTPTAGPMLSDAQGNVTFSVDRGFSGYAQFSKGTDITPGLYFFNPSPDHDLDSVSVQIVTPPLVAGLTGTLMSPQQDANGLTLISAVDCNSVAAVGVAFVADGIDPNAVTFYSVGGFPTASVTETAMEGFGGFVNVPPGPLTVKGEVVGTKRELQTISVLIRAGAITYAKLVPVGR